jgi:hypothetical protein
VALATSVANPQTESQQPGKISLRAVLLGLLTIFVSTVYMDHHASNLVKAYLPVAVLIPFVAWIVLNTLIRITFPRFALDRVELLTILGMLWVGGNLPAVGWGAYAVSLVPSPHFFAAPENRLAEVVLPLLPNWLFLNTNDPRVLSAYTGLAPGEALPWFIWVRPFFWWLVGCLATVFATLFGTILFFKQWDEQERLVFPMSKFPVDILETDDDGIPSVFKNQLFWIGFSITAVIILWNIAGYFAISLPRISLFDQYRTKEIVLGKYYPPLFLRIQPLLMGLAYLCPTDILFSIWAYCIVNTFKIGFLNRTGFTVGIAGQPAEAGAISGLESNGALFMLVGWSLWISRRHLRDTIRRAMGPRSQDDGSPVTYRTAWAGWILSILILFGWMNSMGISFIACVLQLTFLFVCYFGISKYAAATGFTFITPAGGKGYGIIRSITGTAGLSPPTQTMLQLLQGNMFLGATVRTTFVVAFPHIFKMLGRNLWKYRSIWIIMIFAYIFGFAAAAGSRIHQAYEVGGLNGLLHPNDMYSLARNIPFIEGSKVFFFDYQKLTVWLVGAGEAAVLTLLRSRFTWWPIHPVAIAFPERRYAFAIFLVWAAKASVLRLGGVALYRRSIPFWYGAIFGYLFGIALSSLIDAVWFPDGGHFVHGF